MEKDIKKLTNLYVDLRRAQYDFPVDKPAIVAQLDLLNKAIGRLKVGFNSYKYYLLNFIKFDKKYLKPI